MSAGRKYRRQIRRRALFVLPVIPDDAPVEVKDGLALRNTATMTGRCPACGAVAELATDPCPGEMVHAVMEHETDCPVFIGSDR
ncbi:MAG: hypothetical protein M0004_12700 [Actinomycetota bacterium]|nr:hypothetical protein [Actinomycetota bacterium]